MLPCIYMYDEVFQTLIFTKYFSNHCNKCPNTNWIQNRFPFTSESDSLLIISRNCRSKIIEKRIRTRNTILLTASVSDLYHHVRFVIDFCISSGSKWNDIRN